MPRYEVMERKRPGFAYVPTKQRIYRAGGCMIPPPRGCGSIQAALEAAWMGIASIHTNLILRSVCAQNVSAQKLGQLLSELQFLCGLLHCLFCLSCNLRNHGIARGVVTYPILEGIESLAKDIAENAAVIPDGGIANMTANVRLYRDLFSRIATFATYSLAVLHETLLGYPIPTRNPPFPMVNDITSTLKEWMDILNSDPYNRAMLEWAPERGLVQVRRELDPDYQIAATRWVDFAKSHWESIRDGVGTLFVLPATNNFTQWAVEYARATWPQFYDIDAVLALPVVNLAQDISMGKVGPLHYAAMLGLGDVVVSLLSDPQSTNMVNASGSLGPPLFCALVGPRALRFRCQPPSWGVLMVEMEPASTAVLEALITRGGGSDFTFEMPNMDSKIPLSHLAFVAATMLEEAGIFTHVARQSGRPLEDDFTLMLLSSSIFDDKAESNPRLMSELMTAAFDQAMVMSDDNLPWENNVICIAITGFMDRMGLFFTTQTKIRLPFIKNEDFDYVIRQCILDDRTIFDDQPVYFERLVLDERFNPNLRAKDGSDEEGTIVHLAVSGIHDAVIHELHLAGADFTALDGLGRTPLMVVEQTSTLHLLVHEYKITTTTVNNNGQNIWHLAAATNDDGLLMWLCRNDPDKDTNINVVSNFGRTPLADALFCISHQANVTNPRAAKVLLEEKQVDVRLGTANLPMADLIAQWRDIDLVKKLASAGVEIYSP